MLVSVGEHRKEQTDKAQPRKRVLAPRFQHDGDHAQLRQPDEGGHDSGMDQKQQHDAADQRQDRPGAQSHRSETAGSGQQIPDQEVEVKTETVVQTRIHQQQQVRQEHGADRASGHQPPPPRGFARFHGRDGDKRGQEQAGNHIQKGVGEGRGSHDGHRDAVPLSHARNEETDDGEHQYINDHQVRGDRVPAGKPQLFLLIHLICSGK